MSAVISRAVQNMKVRSGVVLFGPPLGMSPIFIPISWFKNGAAMFMIFPYIHIYIYSYYIHIIDIYIYIILL